MTKHLRAFFLALLAAFIQVALAAEQRHRHESANAYINGNALVVRDSQLNDRLVSEAFALLDANPEIQRLWLIDIPGGSDIPGARLAWRAQEMDVIVAGACFAACADVALSARTLGVASWHGEFLSAILVRGSFASLAGEFPTQSNHNQSRYAERLAPISRKDIGDALSLALLPDAGLYIFADDSVKAAKGQTALICSEFPEDCRAINVSLDQIRISKSNLPVPARPSGAISGATKP